MLRSWLTGAAIALACTATYAFAQQRPIAFTVDAAATAATVHPGGRVTLRIVAVIPKGWHLYALTEPPGGPAATTIAVGPPGVASLAGAVGSAHPTLAPDESFHLVTGYFEDSAAFSVPVEISPLAVAGRNRIALRVDYQTCNARYCLPSREDTLTASVVVAGEPVTAADFSAASSSAPLSSAPPSPPPLSSATAVSKSSQPPPPSSTPTPLVPASGSLGLFLWLAATMGALSLLTPCVFPMVPITISYFSRSEPGRTSHAVGEALLYATGIVVAFTGLGLGMSLLFGSAALNRLAANPWLNVAIAALFVLFALSLFGAIELPLPTGIAARLDSLSRTSRLGRAGTTLLIGVTFAVTSFTCTAPLVGTLLVSATQGDWRWPAIGLIVFSSVLALPFLVFALVPTALSRLPRSGEWMVTLRGTLGFLELAAAMKFLSNADLVDGWGVFSRSVVLATWMTLAFALSLYLGGIRLSASGPRVTSDRHVVAALIAVAVGAGLSIGLRGRRLGELDAFLPPAGRGASGVARGDELAWRIDDLAGAIGESRRSHRAILIDFTGYTCTNCRWMEANMFPRDDVRRELARYARVRLFTDGRTSRDRDQQLFEQRHFRTAALPLYAIVDSIGRTEATFVGMTRSADEFIRFLAQDSIAISRY